MGFNQLQTHVTPASSFFNLARRQWGQALFLAGVSVACLGTSATASETITLRYLDNDVTVPLSGLQTFAETGTSELSELQEFADQNPQAVTVIQDVLTTEIYLNPDFVTRNLNSATGEFVLIQLNKFITSPVPQQNLDAIRTALVSAYSDDNRFSLLELMDAYPTPELLVNLSGLEPVYQDVRAFVEDVLPALNVAREFLQDIVCDCEDVTATTEAEASADTSPADTSPADASPEDNTIESSPQSRTVPAHPAAHQATADASTCQTAASVKSAIATGKTPETSQSD